MSMDSSSRINEKLDELIHLVAEMNKYRFAEQYLDNEEFTKLLKISKKTAQLWRENRIIPYAQLGKKNYYRLSDIELLFEKEFSQMLGRKKKELVKRERLKQSLKSNGWTIKV